jgi:hypothetical protein
MKGGAFLETGPMLVLASLPRQMVDSESNLISGTMTERSSSVTVNL